ncbi:MAG: TetR family transcriptional regulator [Solirubrobacterales bacterium]|nr:TetR family transcriptional regulator [Solirubrobacterales bacterium]
MSISAESKLATLPPLRDRPRGRRDNPEQLGEQLALLLDGASARNRVLDNGSFAAAAAATAAVLIDNAIPAAARR